MGKTVAIVLLSVTCIILFAMVLDYAQKLQAIQEIIEAYQKSLPIQ